MSLTVDWSRITPPLTDDEKDHAAYSVGIALLVCGIPRLDTVADVSELLFRMRFYSRLNSPILRNAQGDDIGITLAFWRRWANVRVNGSKETRAAWLKRMVADAAHDIDYAIRQEV